MDNNFTIVELKNLLRREVALLCKPQKDEWNAPILEVVQTLRESSRPSRLFLGGRCAVCCCHDCIIRKWGGLAISILLSPM